MAIDAGQDDQGRLARRLMRQAGRAALGTSFAGRPYVSLVACACDIDASPLLLLSDLAQHSRNLAADPRVSLLFEDSASENQADPLAGARLTVLGEAVRDAGSGAAARFAARHPTSAAYAGFTDFHLYRINVERGHLVAGFGRIAWVDAAALRVAGDAADLAAAEADIIAHMNTDHADAVALYAGRLADRMETGWQLAGIDPDGIDLRCRGIDLRRDGQRARIDFPAPVLTPAAARRALIALVERARNTPPR